MTSKAATVDQYLAELPEDRRAIVEALRDTILKNLPKGYQETMQYGAIGYSVPHSIFPDGYHCNPKEPLPFAGIGNQKNYVTLSLMMIYGDEKLSAEFQKAWIATGKKLDMGKACIRITNLDNVPLDLVGQTIAAIPVEGYVSRYVAVRDAMKSRKK